ncbi:site-specific integrase [Leptothrix discophora]|uniref:Site-specific integrase n=1 Tax=Leptothrix discophora TaxID=89 RepID=A0ABT9G672_LEPDI|nr:site-specific integrase [Leptothrix discophora]MDP4301981.1 site-specific integrase [Leptothrix discophora]
MGYGDGLRRNRCGVWCWRWVVPADVRGAVGAVELLRSLQTASRREAVERSLPLRQAASVMLRHLRSGSTLSDLDKQTKTILQLVARRKAEAIEADEEAEREAAFERAQDELRRRAKEAAFQDGIAKRDKVILLLQQKIIGLQAGATASPSPAVPVEVGPTLAVAISEFSREHRVRSSWTTKTAARWDVTFRALAEYLGQDRPVSSIRRSDCVDFFERLQRLPKNASKYEALRDLDFIALTDPSMTDVTPIAAGTANDFMTRVSSFFKWVSVQYGIGVNPAQGLQIANVEPTSRLPFDESELTRLFNGREWAARRFLHPHYYWIMLLGIYTGARLNELAQLRIIDFVKLTGVDVINIADVGDDENVRRKTAAATRPVPIHGELVRLGLLRWVERQRQSGAKQLFGELKPGRDGHGQAVSKWFQRYRDRCGITGTQAKVFHSFRAGFISQLLNAGVAQHMVANIVGHETGTVAGDVYWTDRDPVSVLEAVNKFALPETVRALIPNIEDVSFGPKSTTAKKAAPAKPVARRSKRKAEPVETPTDSTNVDPGAI